MHGSARRKSNLLTNNNTDNARLCFTQHLPHATHMSSARKGNQTKAKTMHISTPTYALTQALFLALTAPSDEQAARASGLADFFAKDLTDVQIRAAQERAVIMFAEAA